MDADTAESLLKRSSVTIRFLKDDEEMVAGLQIEKKDKDTYYAYLTLDSGLVAMLRTGIRILKSRLRMSMD